nr:MAG TPA: Fez1 [Caudoviricetes sp.]
MKYQYQLQMSYFQTYLIKLFRVFFLKIIICFSY